MAYPILITAPAAEPLTLAEARLHLRIDDDITEEDTLLEALIKAVRSRAEHELGRRLVTQTWDMVLDAFPDGTDAIRLHSSLWQPQSITHVQYLDTAAVVQTMSAADYTLDPHTAPGYVFLNEGASWPGDAADSANAVKVRVVCGYGAAATDVPEDVRAWMKLQLGTLWEHRAAIASGVNVSELPGRFVAGLLDPHRHYA